MPTNNNAWNFLQFMALVLTIAVSIKTLTSD
jgi:hypothetical protein